MSVPMQESTEWLPELDVRRPETQRRLTVFFRLLLLIPQYVVLWLLGIATFFVAIAGWFAALFTGRLPDFAERYLSDYVTYATRVGASYMLLVDTYPPFAFRAPDYPVQVELRPGDLNRLAVLLRIFLIIPAAIIAWLAMAGWTVCAIVIWLIVLVLARMPQSLFDASAATLRFVMRTEAFWLMVTSSYPKRLFGDGEAGAERAPGTRPLLMTSGARLLLILFLVLGFIGAVTSGSEEGASSDTNTSSAIS